MPIRPQVPASLRYYFRARLRPFTRPAFWASLSVLSLIGLFMWEAWQHPEWLFKNPEDATPIADTTLSQEDSAVAADIDNLQLLMKELDDANVNVAALNFSQPPQTQSVLEDLLKQQAAEAAKIAADAQATQPSAAPLTVYDPLGIETQAPSNPGSLYGGGVSPRVNQTPAQSSGVGVSNLAGSTLQTPTTTQVSPLQAALDRLGNNSPTTSVPSQTQINSPAANTNSAAPGQVPQPLPLQVVQPASPYTGTSNYSNMPGQVVQPGSPYPGYPGYTVPPATSNPVNSYTYLNQTAPVPAVPPAQPVVPQVAPVTQGNYGVPAYQNPAPVNGVPNNFGATQVQPSQLEPSPFSVPRPIPGRYIGGGQINTFSNP
ncbi:MAG TPA: hypothetical protein DCY88_06675 [Cyanobacteria bacterium UBA11372]|nr:hypothetical protein [Cyanobacteria bacterium UBA11372]